MSHAIGQFAFGVDVDLISGAIYFVGDGVDLARPSALLDLAVGFGVCRVVAGFEHVANGGKPVP